MPEPFLLAAALGWLGGVFSRQAEKISEGVSTEIAGAIVDRLGLEPLQARLQHFFDSRTNHDVQGALRRAWERAVQESFAAYREENEFEVRHLNEQGWLTRREQEFLSDETLEFFFPLDDQMNAETLLLSPDSVYLGRSEAVNLRLQGALEERDLLRHLPKNLLQKIRERLLSGLAFHFVEEIKQDAKARDGFFFRQFLKIRESDAAAQERLDALWSEWQSLAAQLKNQLESSEDYREHREWRAWVAEMLSAIRYTAEDTRSEVRVIHGELTEIGRGVKDIGERVAPAPRNPREHIVPVPEVGPCFGREAETETIIAACCAENPDPVPLLGGPGIGKSALARNVLNHEDIVWRYKWRRYYVECQIASDRHTLAVEAARVVGLESSSDPEPGLLHELGREPAILVLDNLETPLQNDGAGVASLLQLLSGVDGLALLITRRGDELPGDLTWSSFDALEPLKPDPARNAFCAIAKKISRSDPFLDRLLEAVERVPLPLTLLAHQAEGMTGLELLWKRWEEQRTRMMRRGGGRHRLENWHISVELSREPLDANARRLLSLMALLPAGLSESHLSDFLPGDGWDAGDALRRFGLAERRDGRLRSLAPVREYVSRAYPPEAEDFARMRDHYLGLAREWGPKVGWTDPEEGEKNGREAVRRLTPESANIEEVIERALNARYSSDIADAACALGEFSRFTGIGGTRPLTQTAEAAQSAADFWRQANCIRSLGDIALARSQHEEARQSYTEALPLYEQVGDVLGQANCIRSLGDIAREGSDFAAALPPYHEALALYAQIQEPYSMGVTHYRLAQVTSAAERRRHVETARALWTSIGLAHLLSYLDEFDE